MCPCKPGGKCSSRQARPCRKARPPPFATATELILRATQSPSGRVEGYNSPILALRKQLDLYANLRPIASMPVPRSQAGIDMLIVRENTECLYVRQERLEDGGNTAVGATRDHAPGIRTHRARSPSTRRAAVPAIPTTPAACNRGAQGQRAQPDRWPLPRGRAWRWRHNIRTYRWKEQLVDSMIYRMIRRAAAVRRGRGA